MHTVATGLSSAWAWFWSWVVRCLGGWEVVERCLIVVGVLVWLGVVRFREWESLEKSEVGLLLLLLFWSHGVGRERDPRVEVEVGYGEDASHVWRWERASGQSWVCLPVQHCSRSSCLWFSPPILTPILKTWSPFMRLNQRYLIGCKRCLCI